MESIRSPRRETWATNRVVSHGNTRVWKVRVDPQTRVASRGWRWRPQASTMSQTDIAKRSSPKPLKLHLTICKRQELSRLPDLLTDRFKSSVWLICSSCPLLSPTYHHYDISRGLCAICAALRNLTFTSHHSEWKQKIADQNRVIDDRYAIRSAPLTSNLNCAALAMECLAILSARSVFWTRGSCVDRKPSVFDYGSLLVSAGSLF